MSRNVTPKPLILRVLSGPEQGRTFPLRGGMAQIGRDPGVDFPLSADTTVSKLHASLSWEAPHWILRDLGSKNGTFVESEGNRYPLESGHRVDIGTRFWLGSAQIGVEAVPAGEVSEPLERVSIGVHEGRLCFQFETPDAVVARFEQSWHPEVVESVLGRLRGVLATAEAAQHYRSDAPFTEIGEALNRELIPAAVAERLYRRDAPALSLLLDPALVHLPWELLCDGGRHLCLERPLARQTVGSPALARPALVSRAPSFLIVANPDGTLPATQEEGEALLHLLVEEAGLSEVRFLAHRRARKQDVLRQLDVASVVYYLGHAEHDAANPRNSAWLLADGRLTADELGRLMHPPELVIANACESARESLEHQTPGGVLPPEGAGLGLSLLLAGVRHYVGTLWRVPAVSAAGCGAVLLRELLDGAPIGSALLCARRYAREAHGDSAMTWAAYALYGNPHWRLRH